jgi:hypothetical protein
MTLLWTFSWHFLLILAPERARRVNWGLAPHPAQVGLGVRKCPQEYLVDNIEPENTQNFSKKRGHDDIVITQTAVHQRNGSSESQSCRGCLE